MLKIKVTESVLRIAPGAIVGLSKSQAAARMHAIQKEGEAFRAKQALEFKVGEELEVANIDDLPKAMRPVVTGVDAPLPGGVQAKPKKAARKVA